METTKVTYQVTSKGLVKITPVNRVRRQTANDYENMFMTPASNKKVPSKIKLFKQFTEDLAKGQQYVTWLKDKGEQREALIQAGINLDYSLGFIAVHNVSIALGIDEHADGSTSTHTRIPVNSILSYSNPEVGYYV